MRRERAVDKSPRTYDAVLAPMELIWFTKWRKEVLSEAYGHVLDIGTGTGINLKYYPEDIDCVTVIDPSLTNIAYLRRKARGGGWGEEGGRCLRSHVGVGENLPFRSASFDTVVSTLILCTVEDPSKVVSEGIRVLKKGGRMIFLEHQRPRLLPQALLFDLISPLWRAPSGCNLNRHTEVEIEKRRELKKICTERRGPVLGYPFFIGIYEKI
jgi:ubiquinone/menaquinone biosynthesis C-methylase UbiE